jgi:hypothetical protein
LKKRHEFHGLFFWCSNWIEARQTKVQVVRYSLFAAGGFHYGKADRVRIGDRVIFQFFQPAFGRLMMSRAHKFNPHQRACFNLGQGCGRGSTAGSVKKKPMGFGQYQICRDQRLFGAYGCSESAIRIPMVLISSAE